MSGFSKQFSHVFTPQTQKIITELSRQLLPTHSKLLKKRYLPQNFNYREDTKDIRNDPNWSAIGPNKDILKRHVEITGPASDTKMMINALNSDANVYMTDLEDSCSPTWENIQKGHSNIYSALRGDLKFKNENKNYTFNVSENSPILMTRLRGLHMFEKNFLIQNTPVPAMIFDFATFIANNAELILKNEQKTNGKMYFYIPKIQTYEEAQFVNKMFTLGEEMLNIPKSSIRATLLIETFPAIFQTDEIIYALKDYICGLNCGRWDYLFSLIKSNMSYNIPNRSILSMDQPFLTSYIERIVQTSHQRKIHAMGGMSAFIPTGGQNQHIIDKIINDKLLEIKLGCDGAWVAHPGLIEPVKNLFMNNIKDNQYHIIPNRKINDNEFLSLPDNIVKPHCFTYKEFQNNLRVAIKYLTAWLNGSGAVAINGLMEDMATCEISLYQIKQWIKNGKPLANENFSIIVNKELFLTILEEEKNNVKNEYIIGDVDLAGSCIIDYVINHDEPFLQNIAYNHL